GGERQRLALSRALVRKPAVLILDEATSALDATNERHVLDAVARLPWDITGIIITHRPSALSEADVIHTFDGGRPLETTSRRRVHGSSTADLKLCATSARHQHS